MLADMALEPPSDSLDGVLATGSEDEHMTLTTIHSAKGLEWKVVFLIWAADGRFPGPQSVGDDEIEEERRLMYVASTRARDELYLSYPIYMFDRSFGFVMGRVSRFLEDVPGGVCLQTATLQESEESSGLRLMLDDRIIRAARNNAQWCDAVCRAHGNPGEFHDDIWLNRHASATLLSERGDTC